MWPFFGIFIFAKEGVKCYSIWILKPVLESSHQLEHVKSTFVMIWKFLLSWPPMYYLLTKIFFYTITYQNKKYFCSDVCYVHTQQNTTRATSNKRIDKWRYSLMESEDKVTEHVVTRLSQQNRNVRVEKVGLVANKEVPYLEASPDVMVRSDCQTWPPKRVLETWAQKLCSSWGEVWERFSTFLFLYARCSEGIFCLRGIELAASSPVEVGDFPCGHGHRHPVQTYIVTRVCCVFETACFHKLTLRWIFCIFIFWIFVIDM